MNYLTLQQLIFSSDPIIRNNAMSIKKQIERNAKDCQHTSKIGDDYHTQCTACFKEFVTDDSGKTTGICVACKGKNPNCLSC